MVWGEGFTGWLRQNQPEHLRLGRLGERAAKRHLKQAGLKFLYANFKGEQGEIDLVFREGKVLVFVEVKARSSESWTRPAAAVNAAKQRRIVATAREYVRMLPEGEVPIRFDIVEVLLEDGRVGKCGINPMHLPPRGCVGRLRACRNCLKSKSLCATWAPSCVDGPFGMSPCTEPKVYDRTR